MKKILILLVLLNCVGCSTRGKRAFWTITGRAADPEAFDAELERLESGPVPLIETEF